LTKEEKFQKITLFRYSRIAPALTNTFEAPSHAQYFRNVASKAHLYPDGRHVRVSPHSLERWLYMYKRHGIQGITPKARADNGRARVLSEAAVGRIHEIRGQFQYITGKAIYKKLIQEGLVNAKDVSLASVQRYLRNNGLKPAPADPREVRAFEMETANDCWQTDGSEGPVITIDGKRTKTVLIALIDDASRMILHAQFYTSENSINMQDAFRKAAAKFGIPKKIFLDNGGAFNNLQLQLICASLGTVLVHCRPYVAKSRGKVERLFRTIKDGWMNATDWNLFSSLEDIDASLAEYLAKEYTNTKHGSLPCSPKQRFMQDYESIRHIPAAELDLHFLHRQIRRVTNAATIRLFNMEYEVPQQYIGSKINIRYLPSDISELFIFSDGGEMLHTIRPVKKTENSKIKRSTIDYT
jgi:transposase InsO family protein